MNILKQTNIFFIFSLFFLFAAASNAAPAELFGTNLIADIADRVSPAVVAIESVHYVRTRRSVGTGDPLLDRLFGHLFADDFSGHNNVIPKKGSGSGVIISGDGHLLTNEHVINGADEILVKLSDNKTLKAKIVGKDPQTDLAVLKIDSETPLPFVPIGDSSKNRVGEWVIAIGNPFGLGITVTAGVISAINRDISVEKDRAFRDLIQTDASINPGNSGGALVNSRGELVGVNTAIIPYGQGIGFAIPVNRAKRIIGDLIEYGRVKKAFAGVSVQTVTQELAAYFNIPNEGVLVTEVIKDSAAGKANLVPGDVILEIDSRKIGSNDDFQKILDEYRVNDKAILTVLRKGKKGTREIEFKENPLSKNILGISVSDCTDENIKRYGLYVDRGCVITGVAKGYPADRAGLEPGDVILQINNELILKEKDFNKIIKDLSEDTQIILRVVRGRRSTLLLIKIE